MNSHPYTSGRSGLVRANIRRRLAPAVFIFVILLGVCVPMCAENADDDAVLVALKAEMERSKAKLKMENVPAPYYIEYRVTQIDAFDATAVFGALRNQQRGMARFLRVVVRIGDFKQDSYYGTGQGVVDVISIDEDVYAIRYRLWLATDRAYKAAAEALTAKQNALKQLKVDEPVDDFSPASAVQSVQALAHLPSEDFSPWVELLEESSGQSRTDLALEHFESSLRFAAENRYLINSEGTAIRDGQLHYWLSVAGTTQAPDGMLLERSRKMDATELSKLPTRDEFLRTTTNVLETLKKLRDAPVVDEEYRGPVLLSNNAGAAVVEALIEPNVLGRKPQPGENGRTSGRWSSSYKARVLPTFITVVDDPTISSLSGQPLFGHYQFDDEGVKAQRVAVIQQGQLTSYLMGREPIRDFPASNGHGRASPTAGASPSPGNLILESSEAVADQELKKKLMEMAGQRGLAYGLYVVSMGARLEPRLTYRVYVNDGHEELVRGALFGDLDVRSLRSDLVSVGNTPAVETRFDPIAFSIASPALLFDELQVKRTPASKQELPEYSAPPLSDAAIK